MSCYRNQVSDFTNELILKINDSINTTAIFSLYVDASPTIKSTHTQDLQKLVKYPLSLLLQGTL